MSSLYETFLISVTDFESGVPVAPELEPLYKAFVASSAYKGMATAIASGEVNPEILAEFSAYGKSNPELRALLKATHIFSSEPTKQEKSTKLFALIKIGLGILGIKNPKAYTMYDALVGSTARYTNGLGSDNKLITPAMKANTVFEHIKAAMRDKDRYVYTGFLTEELMVELVKATLASMSHNGKTIQYNKDDVMSKYIKDGKLIGPFKGFDVVAVAEGFKEIDRLISIGIAQSTNRDVRPLLHAGAGPNVTIHAMDMNKDSVYSMFDTLANAKGLAAVVSPEHKKHLRRVLDVITPTMDLIKLKIHKDSRARTKTYGSTEGENLSITIGTRAKLTGISMTPAEVLVHELLHTLISRIDKASPQYRKLEHAYKVARKTIKPEHFLKEGFNSNKANL